MKHLHHVATDLSWRRAFTIASAFVSLLPAASFAQQYQEKDLVSPTEMEGTNPPDPNLKNPWGMARGTDIFWWVSEQRDGGLYPVRRLRGKTDIFDGHNSAYIADFGR